MNHLCDHGDHGQHQCHCGIGSDHTFKEFLIWHESRHITPLDSQIR